VITVAGVATQSPSIKLLSPLEMTTELVKYDAYMIFRYPPTLERDETFPEIDFVTEDPRVSLRENIKVGLLEEGLLGFTLTTLTLLKFKRERRRFDNCQI
jgi:hypothetical protein